MLSLIIIETSFQFNGKDYLQTHGTVMGTKMEVTFFNIYMVSIEKEISRQSVNKPLTCKRVHWRGVFLMGRRQRRKRTFHWERKLLPPNYKVCAEVSQLGTTFLDTTVYKGERFKKESTIDVRTHYKPTETFQYTNLYNSCHPSGVEKGFVKVEALRILRTNSSRVALRKNNKNFRARLRDLERLS